MKISVVGAGYVGLVTGAGFAEMGNDVVLVETDPAKVRLLESGQIPIHEPGLEPIVTANAKAGRLTFTTSLSAAAEDCEIFFIAVGTPPSPDGSPDMSYVYGVAAEVGRTIDNYAVLVTKSTVPVGTADRVRAIVAAELDKRKVTVEFDVVSNPEFLKEGAAVKDFMNPERVVLGCDSQRAEDLLRKLYAPFVRARDRILAMRPREAEMTKYASNALLATKISFMNEVAELCDELDVDVERVRAGVGADSRIGYAFLYAGCGYGGSCFPKDIKALIHTARQAKTEAGILEAVEERNARQKLRLFEKVTARFGADLNGRTFAVWGLAFKPDTDDIREASSLTIIERLIGAGAKVRAYDPIAVDNVRKSLPATWVESRQLTFCEEPYDVFEGADALLLVTEWREFRNPNFGLMKRRLKGHVIFDGRNQYDPADVEVLGFEYYGIGRGRSVREAQSSAAAAAERPAA